MKKNYQKILVAIDGSDEAEQAFKKAVAIAKKNKSQLFIAHISDSRSLRIFPNLDRPDQDNTFIDQAYNMAETTLNTYKKWAEKQHLLEVKTILRVGSPKIEISTNLPKEYNIDLILLGATGLNAVERLLIGSVSEYVARNAPCDVLIARSDEAETHEHNRIANNNF